MKGLKNLRKATPLLILGTLIAVGLASAALLSYYGIVVGTATVSQSVQISEDQTNWLTCTNETGGGCTLEDQIEGVAGSDIYAEYYIKNDADYDAAIVIDDYDTPIEVEELEVAVVEDLSANCSLVTEYHDILGSPESPASYPTIIPAGETMKICEHVKFKINTLAGDYTITLNISPTIMEEYFGTV